MVENKDNDQILKSLLKIVNLLGYHFAAAALITVYLENVNIGNQYHLHLHLLKKVRFHLIEKKLHTWLDTIDYI
jgi:hypothetical protein